MKSRLLLLSLFVLALAVMTTGELLAQTPQVAPKNPAAISGGDPQFGLIPPPMDLSHIKAIPGLERATASAWDWRALGGVTSVKNQNPYGTCWCFGYLGVFEASVLINESIVNDYSEINIQGCNVFSQNCFTGGNAWIATNYLALLGTVDEVCDPYPGDCPNSTCINFACSFDKQVTEWRLIPNDVASIKAAVQTWGPCYTSMYASFPGFSTYDGTYCMSYTGTEGTNHGVVIVGWDDDMCGGNGAWIIKNSWGTAWGDNGFFYIEYGSARVGTNVNLVTGYKDFDPSEKIYYYDDYGWWTQAGFSDGDDWGMVKLTPSSVGEQLTAVDFWAVAAPGTYTVKVYDDFSGTAVSTLLAGPIVKTTTEEGYFSVSLPAPLDLTMGDPVYIEVEFSNGYNWPVPIDDEGPMESGKTFISSDGLTYISLGSDDAKLGDVSIRGRVTYEVVEDNCSKEGDPGIYGNFYASASVIRGETYCDLVAPANFGFISDYCTGMDTFCMHYYDDLGWAIVGTDSPEGESFILDSGTYYTFEVCITVPCDGVVGMVNNVCAMMAFTDVNNVCAPECGDCQNPNFWDPDWIYNTTCTELTIVESPPALYVLQDTLYLVEIGLAAAYVPFGICNGDPCAAPTDYGYHLWSLGHIGSAIDVNTTVTAVEGGKCKDVYGILDAGEAEVCDYDTLTIIAWSLEGTIIYDTCVQVIHIVEPVDIPLFSAPVIAVLALAMIIAAAVIMKRRMADNS